jgi:hypothetical protein
MRGAYDLMCLAYGREPEKALNAQLRESETIGIEVRVMPGGMKVKRWRDGPLDMPSGGGGRGRIRGFSQRSRATLRERAAGVAISESAAPSKRSIVGSAYFLTLTYHQEFPSGGSAQYAHLKEFWRRMTRTFGAAGGLWVKAAQARGVPHWHLLVIFEGETRKRPLRKFTARIWNQIAGAGSRQHMRFGSDVRIVDRAGGSGPLRSYLLQYMTSQSGVADTHEWGRRWGVLGSLNLQTLGVFWFHTISEWGAVLEKLRPVFSGNPYAGRFEAHWSGFLSGEGLHIAQNIASEGMEVFEGCPF